MSNAPPVWDIYEVAAHLGVTPAAAYKRLVRAGITSVRFEASVGGGAPRALYDEQQVRAWHQAKHEN